ncbi:MAG: insulinase family protein [Deltaproteobacteria bacterium]|nr:insulinase family protein [Deltaproteobacteria bacterium]
MRVTAQLAGLIGLASLLACASFVETPIWERPPPPIRDSRVVEPGKLHRFELDNGLLLIVLEDHRLPRVSLGIELRRGAASVGSDRAGLAGFTAELMKRGAGDRDAFELASAVDALGSAFSMRADWDSITAQIWGLTRDLDSMLEILGDVVLRPRFDEEEATRARGELLAAIERATADPNYLERRFAAAALYPGVRAGLPLSGIPETVAALDSAAAREFHAQMFVPNNAIFFASGDLDASELLDRVGAVFGAWPAGEVPDPGPPLPAPTPTERRILIVDRPDLTQARITLAHEGISRAHPDRIAAGLLNEAIGGSGFSSRLMQRVRADAGLTYGVSSRFSMHRGGGTFAVATFTRVAEVRTVIDLLLTELERARREPPAGMELEEMRALQVGQFALGIETSDAVLGSLVNLDVYGLPEDSLDTYRSRVRAVTAADVGRLALELMHPDRAAIVLVGPADALVPQLQDLGPVEVIRP